MNASAAVATGPVTLYPRRHARKQVGKAFGHLGPAVVLLMSLTPVLAGSESLTPLLGLEALLGTAYLVLMMRELRHLRHDPFYREPVAWLEPAAAAILALESYHIGTTTMKPNWLESRLKPLFCPVCMPRWQ